jgi:DUF1680 family protein
MSRLRGYLRIKRDWSSGERVVLSLAIPVRRLSGRRELMSDLGRVALHRGPGNMAVWMRCTNH